MTHATPLNSHCPWSGDAVSDAALTTYHGQTVAFCSADCRNRFERATLHFAAHAVPAPASARPFRSRARYNTWMNERLLAALATLSEADYRRDLGAFFGSVHVTMNHLMVWDVVWLKRLAERFPHHRELQPLHTRALPAAHDQELCANLAQLRQERATLDAMLEAYAERIGEAEGEQILDYRTQSGARVRKRVDGVLTHLFNHQTHHRGQVTTLLSQLGVDPGDTDLLLTLEDY